MMQSKFFHINCTETILTKVHFKTAMTAAIVKHIRTLYISNTHKNSERQHNH